MDAGRLGGVLTGTGALYRASDKYLNPNRSLVAVTVSEVRRGSLIIGLAEASTFFPQLNLLVSNIQLASITDVLFGDQGIVDTILRFAGRQLITVVPILRSLTDYRMIAKLEDDQELEIPGLVFEIMSRASVGPSLRKIVRPLADDGVERLEVTTHDGRIVRRIDSTEVRYFDNLKMPTSADHTETHDVSLEIAGPTFKGSQPWRLATREGIKSVKIDDSNFLRQIESGTKFARGDRLNGTIEITTRSGRATYVLRHVVHQPFKGD